MSARKPRETGRPSSREWTNPETGRTFKRVWANIVNGNIPISEMDSEELARGQLKDANGNFSGAPGQLMPRELADARQREVLKRVEEQFLSMATKATQVYVDVLEDPAASHSDKMKAAEYLHMRFMGKVPDRLEMKAEMKPWEGLVSGAILRDVPDDAASEEQDSDSEEG